MIDFISAKDGGIEMSNSNGVVAYAKTPEGIASSIETNILADAVYGSSSMDFADEEGFATHDGAKKLWDQAIEIYNWNVNKVA